MLYMVLIVLFSSAKVMKKTTVGRIEFVVSLKPLMKSDSVLWSCLISYVFLAKLKLYRAYKLPSSTPPPDKPAHNRLPSLRGGPLHQSLRVRPMCRRRLCS